MTPRARAKQARHNAAKDAKRRRLTVGEMEQAESNLRRQEAEANEEIGQHIDDLNEVFDTWRAEWNNYVIPRLCVGFFYAAYRDISKFLAKGAVDSYMNYLTDSMQGVVEKAGELGNDYFEECRSALAEAGFTVPEWAEEEDFEKIKEMMRRGRKL